MTTSKSLAKLISVLEKKYKNPEKAVEKFLKYADRKNLLYKIPNVLKHLERMVEARKDTFVSLTTATKISLATEAKIKKFIGVEEQTPVETRLDPGLIGGFIAEHDNYIYDGSLNRQLKILEEVLLEN